jgi:hypothetical protein
LSVTVVSITESVELKVVLVRTEEITPLKTSLAEVPAALSALVVRHLIQFKRTSVYLDT